MDRAQQALKTYRKNPDDVGVVFRAACEDIVSHIGSTRASVWLFNTLGDSLTCAALFDSREGKFSSGVVLEEDDFPEYFAAVRSDLWIKAEDAANHPATRCFEEPYFLPLDIRSLLDFVVMVGDRHVAVLCCEHCGDERAWSDADRSYLSRMAAMLGLAFRAHLSAAAA